jgi:tripartite-type tricarboxylate transporter receptor subunit TctC
MSNRVVVWFSILVLVLSTWAGAVANAAPPYYEGKTVRIVVGFSAGGGFDITARVIAQYMPKYIPGHPTMIVENMPGASSLIAANNTYARTKPDGLTIGLFHGNMILLQVLGGDGIAFDARKFEYVGAMEIPCSACVATKKSGIDSMEKWKNSREPVKLGGIAPGSAPSDVPRVLEKALKLPIKLVEGHKGTPEIRLAAERGEIAGFCSPWDSIKVIWTKALESGDAVVLVQVASKRHPDLPNVPLATEFAMTDDARQMIKSGIIEPSRIFRTFALPPGTPKEYVQVLAKAFMDTMKDPEFVAAAEKAQVEVEPVASEDVQKTVGELLATPQALCARLKEVLAPK